MSPAKDGARPPGAANGHQKSGAEEGLGVLSQLPRTRPQRSSARRVAARAASAAAESATAAPAHSNGRPPARARKPAKAAAKAAPKAAAKAPRAAKATPRRAAARPAPVAEPVPRQGYECEGERASGSVRPPGGAELVATAAEIVGELTKAGLSTGERLLKDLLSHLPLS